MKTTTISQHFANLPDPRIKRTQHHPLVNILTITLCAVICGCDNFNAIEEYGKSKKQWFETFLDMPHGIPSHDTFNDVLNRLSPKAFHAAFTEWVKHLCELNEDIIPLDGKTLRRTIDKVNGVAAIHIVNAWSVKNNLCLGQMRVDDKSNEITAIPKLLELLDIEGATITTDAMGCQFKIADKIVEKQANYIFALKGSQGEFFDDIKLFLDTELESGFNRVTHDVFEEIDKDHGRIEQRKVWVTSDVEWLRERHSKWSSLNSIAVVESIREQKGIEKSMERRYYISSHLTPKAEYIAGAIRSHWFVENKLHWQLDISFDEDSCRLRSGNAAENMATMNKTALNMLKNEKTAKVGIKSKRLKAGWDEDYLMKVLTVGKLSV
ncbi:ISAs1 family transposase [Parashewanella curva]|uniref:ISAs1 family transposase n=1 Tax=Parashewanella curva TaxID=2338552 RepID=A0A3L8Q374_9GAMM|nr:ISAs1 family transposase [Parashewanella curva]RLV61062.1 ISAs1 family transposase [Parashewanella curva]